MGMQCRRIGPVLDINKLYFPFKAESEIIIAEIEGEDVVKKYHHSKKLE